MVDPPPSYQEVHQTNQRIPSIGESLNGTGVARSQPIGYDGWLTRGLESTSHTILSLSEKQVIGDMIECGAFDILNPIGEVILIDKHSVDAPKSIDALNQNINQLERLLHHTQNYIH